MESLATIFELFRAANPTVDFNTTSSSGAESVSSKATVDLSHQLKT